MLRLYMLVSLTWFFKAYAIYRNEKGQADETTNLVLIKDCVYNGSWNIRKVTKFQANLCKLDKLKPHSTYHIQICSDKYRALPLCSNISSTLVTKSDRTTADGCTDPTQQKSYLKAFSKAIQLARGTSASKTVLVLLTNRNIDCHFYGLEPDSGDPGYCLKEQCATWLKVVCWRSKVKLDDRRNRSTKQAAKALNMLLKDFIVIILSIGQRKDDEMKSWAEKANNDTGQIHYKRLNSYTQLNGIGISYVKSVIGMIRVAGVQSAVLPGKPLTGAPKEEIRYIEQETTLPKSAVTEAMTVSEPIPDEVVGNTSRMATTSVAQTNLTSQERVEHGSGQVKWWMILLICCLGLGVILVIAFSILLVVCLKKRAASRACPTADKEHPSKIWKPKDVPDSLATNTIDPLSSPTYDKTKTLPSYLMQAESTMSQDGDHCSSQFPSGITLPNV